MKRWREQAPLPDEGAKDQEDAKEKRAKESASASDERRDESRAGGLAGMFSSFHYSAARRGLRAQLDSAALQESTALPGILCSLQDNDATEGGGKDGPASNSTSSPDAVLAEADLLERALGDLEAARKLYSDLLQRDGLTESVRSTARFRLARVLRLEGKIDLARKIYQELEENSPRYQERAREYSEEHGEHHTTTHAR